MIRAQTRARLPARGTVFEIVSAAVAFAAVGGIAAENGGYFATTWGWAATGLFAVAVVLLLLDGPRRLRRLEWIVLGAVLGLSIWTFVSASWSISVTRSVLEGERSLVYVGGVVVALLLSRRAGGRAVVIGTWLAITAVCTYSLLTRLFPKQFGVVDVVAGNRLSTPVGYWNGLGLLAAIGCLYALGLAARGAVYVRMAAAVSLVVLVQTLYFTFGRGAWIALVVGLAAAFLADRRRLQLGMTALVVAPWPALAVANASQADALTHVGVTLDAAQKDGHAVAVASVLLMTVAALAVLALDTLETRRQIVFGTRTRWILGAVGVAVVVAALAVAFDRYGSPTRIATHAWDSFTATHTSGSNLNNRLFSFSGSGRIDHWRVADHEIAAHPLLGTGAGTFGENWFRLRPTTVIVHDAHNLYLETLSETGPVGLALVVLLLAGLTVAAARSRSALASVVVGAAVAYSLHAVADWDWELPAILLAVVLPALAIADEAPSRRLQVGERLLPAAAAFAIGAFALFALLGNIALARSSNAADATHWREAEHEARSARDLVPWSAEPWRELAVAEVGRGNILHARASLREALATEPNDWSLWYQYAELTTGAVHRHALAEANRLNPRRTDAEATPGDLRLIVIP